MANLDHRRRPAAALTTSLLASLLLTSLPAQEPAAPEPAPAATAEDPTALAAAWLAGDQVDRAARDVAVKALLQQPEVAARWLASELRAAAQVLEAKREKGVHGLFMPFVFGFLQQQRDTEMTFVGQYDLLQQLEPAASALLFGLLADTPHWFPLTDRIWLIAPLRDLHRQPPDPERVEILQQLFDDVDEAEDLRRTAAAALWQWRVKPPAEQILAGLQQTIAEGDGEERVRSTLILADYHCLLREYRQSANAHRAAQALAKSTNTALLPIAWYAAGCVHSLLGEVDLAIHALERCADLLASPALDSSLRLKRRLFERDPELNPLRADPRFQALVRRAFAGTDAESSPPRPPSPSKADQPAGTGR
jgi:tetratricopeptide (TPR) repeat protein